MKPNVLDVLIYLFENFMDEEVDVFLDRDDLESQLRKAGFAAREVDKAFDWLETLAEPEGMQSENPALATGKTFRVFTGDELAKLDTDSRGFLLFLETVGVLDAAARELVIDRVMALDADEIDLEQLKWVILMVLFNQPGQDQAFFWMEDLVMDDVSRSLH
jgi:Smg protein